MTEWPVYRGTGTPHDGVNGLPPPPNWRSFDGGPVMPGPPESNTNETDTGAVRRLGTNQDGTSTPEAVQMVNAALFLRRPLLVTGQPGTGNSTLAYAVARELRLGPVLRWPITSRSTLLDGLYRYDPIGRLREENLRQLRRSTTAESADVLGDDIGQHLRLGPLGTALLPYERPRVLLIDEIDKSDIDLPNDLLNVFEDGEFEIDELSRLPGEITSVGVMTADRGVRATITRGLVQCHAFPFIVLTSNGEREFPPAFLRRCLRLDMRPPNAAQLMSILQSHFDSVAAVTAEKHIQEFLDRRRRANITTDQLLNAVYLATSGSRYANGSPSAFDDVVAAVLRPLTDTSEA